MLNRLGAELHNIADPPPVSVTLPPLQFLKKGPPVDDEPERREVADKFAEFRAIRAGIESWQAISTVNTFDAWTKIAKSLQVGRNHALRATGANAPMGRRYSLAFSQWITKHGFDGIEKTVRSAALDLTEHLEDIEAWRLTLDEKRRRQLKHPLRNVWRMAKGNSTSQGHRPTPGRSPSVAAVCCLCRSIAAR
jgi:hypothetical protein